MNDNAPEKALACFLDAQIPEEEAGSSRMGSREIQVNYYIGFWPISEALGDNATAKSITDALNKLSDES